MAGDRYSFASAESLEKERIEATERSSLAVEEKLDFALLVLGQKQAAQFGRLEATQPDSRRTELLAKMRREISAITALANEMSLPHASEGVREEENGAIGFSVLVGRNKDSLDRLVRADKQEDHRAFGELLGYPATAAAAYRTDEAFNFWKELPQGEVQNLVSEGLLPFLSFMPSRSHWEEELKFARSQQRLIREKAPRLFAELIDYAA